MSRPLGRSIDGSTCSYLGDNSLGSTVELNWYVSCSPISWIASVGQASRRSPTSVALHHSSLQQRTSIVTSPVAKSLHLSIY
jgi:hypothetical protein